MRKKVIATSKAPKAIGPYSQAIDINGALFISGEIPIDPETDKLIEGDVKEQTTQVLRNIDAVLSAAGYSRRDVVLCNCMLDNMDDFQAFNEVYSAYFDKDPPARATLEAARLPMGALVEIEAIAMK
jgi:2-iminobutanoate/2-iminopropanoate deaminase